MRTGARDFQAMRKKEASHQLEEVGVELRKLYSWSDGAKLIDN